MAKKRSPKKAKKPLFIQPPNNWTEANLLSPGRYLIWQQPNRIEGLPAGGFIADVFQFDGQWRYLPEGQRTGSLGQCNCIEDDFRFLGID